MVRNENLLCFLKAVPYLDGGLTGNNCYQLAKALNCNYDNFCTLMHILHFNASERLYKPFEDNEGGLF